MPLTSTLPTALQAVSVLRTDTDWNVADIRWTIMANSIQPGLLELPRE